jgi:hypothetical protein
MLARPLSVLPKPRLLASLALVAVVLLVTSCATRRPAPVEDRALARSPPRTAAPLGAPATLPAEAPAPTYTV